MRFSSSIIAFGLASFAAASPVVYRRGNFIIEDGYPFGSGHGGPPGLPGGGLPGGGLPGGGLPGGGLPGGGLPGGGAPGGGAPGGGAPGGGAPGGGAPGGGAPGGGAPGGGSGGAPGGGSGGAPGGGSGGSGGSGSGTNACGVTPGQISALTPLLDKLGLSTTVDGVKKLVKNILSGVDGLLAGPAVNGSGGLIDTVNNLVKGLLGEPLDLHNTVTALVSILQNQVPCLLDTALPKP
ncbi:hypothetical protein IW140_003678 [Coemansia sp. RSA 1813]|nr:hypothetical protein LPJ74_002945 [Coemansia sp. RSA 1843]KAJ2213708.1 hypothetical protein EV179_003608 [Coemansia sp. RSA 487]KAJ2568689.1 hypothetical protein IW140_003678 [Coemansia sp. RSA 1813]